MNKLVLRQHMLPSVLWLLNCNALTERFSSILLQIKEYSTIMSVLDNLPPHLTLCTSSESCFEINGESNLIVADEGGHLHHHIPRASYKYTAGVEQTTAGLQKQWKIPVVLVCRSAAKLFFESQIIARGVVRKLESMDLLNNRTVGLVGLGALGSAIAFNLITRGVTVLGNDIRPLPQCFKSIAVDQNELLSRSDVILGCTGVDFLSESDLSKLFGEKFFISCSSTDVEFRSLINKLPKLKSFGTITGSVGRLRCIIPNGGYPINFDRANEWELFDEIILTRHLMLEGILQAITLIGTQPRGVMLDPKKQLDIVLEWLEHVPYRHLIRIPDELTVDFFINHSEGEYVL